jgi:hypothetical protein
MLGLPPLVGGGVPFSGSSSATAQGGNVGSFNFSPKAGVSPVVLVLVGVGLLLLLRR